MSEPKTPYPPSPPDVPEGLTDYADSFARQQNRVLTGLFVFLIFYFAMIVLFAMVGVWCVLTFPGTYAVFKVVGAVLGATFCLFLLKGFFKRPAVNREMYVEVTDDEHPILFDFLHQLCDELGAPFPNRVYVCPDVIAEYTVSTSLINLFVEPRRELLIGAGLVNCTNLSEFKAILAHEFGHFCHLGRSKSYCAVVQHIVFDMIEGEDFFDRIIRRCKHNPETDSGGFSLKMVTWPVVYPISWLLEAGHALLWLTVKTVALPGRAMVWEQEYHADLVAVSAAGSDAVTHGLLRARFGTRCFNQAIDDLLKLADGHDLYSNDLYLHQDRAAAIVRWKTQAPEFGLPPELPEPNSGEAIRIFDPEDNDSDDEDTPPMWRGHPSNADREENAKEHFVPAVMDHRSPWVLFDNVAELKELLSYEFYRVVFHIRKNADLVDAQTIQGYIDKEYPEINQRAPVQENFERLFDTGEIQSPGAVESISLVPVEEPIPVVNIPEPLPPAVLVGPVDDELQGETIFDEVIRVVDSDDILSSGVPDAARVAVPVPLVAPLAMPSAEPVAFAEAVAEAVPVPETTPAVPVAAEMEPVAVPIASVVAQATAVVVPATPLPDASVAEAAPVAEPTPLVAEVVAELVVKAVAEPEPESKPTQEPEVLDTAVPLMTETMTDSARVSAEPEVAPAEFEAVPASLETIPQTTVAEPASVVATASVAFGSAPHTNDTVPVPLSEAKDGSATEVFTLDEVEPVPANAGGLLSLDAEDSPSGKSRLAAVTKAELSKPAPLPDDQESRYTLYPDDESLERPAVSKPLSDAVSKPMAKIGGSGLTVATPKTDTGSTTPSPRPSFGSAAVKPDAGATPVPRPGLGSDPAIITCSVSETVVPAAGRRPAVRITFVKPGEKSPIGK
ncbi:MAG: hypothetical protein C0467_20070 [Planctomycetaceae bacterium]|nr:hypothetical protein [Planctomycetaceae bacterium]